MLAKAKVIIKAKMIHIKEGKGTPRDETYAVIAQLPDIINTKTRDLAVLDSHQYTSQEVEWASMVRGMAKFETESEDMQVEVEGGFDRLADSQAKSSMEEYELLQQAGEGVEDRDIMVDDELDEDDSVSSGPDDDEEGNTDEDVDEPDEDVA